MTGRVPGAESPAYTERRDMLLLLIQKVEDQFNRKGLTGSRQTVSGMPVQKSDSGKKASLFWIVGGVSSGNGGTLPLPSGHGISG